MKHLERYREAVLALLDQAGIVITDTERRGMELTDLGLGNFEIEGLSLVVYENNERYCAKELVLLPWQTCPEHRHPPVGDDPGKMETFRVRRGEVYLHVEGEATAGARGHGPRGKEAYYTGARREVVLRPGEQFTIPPNTLHWFQAGAEGAVVSEFSSTSRDESDVFSDPGVRRV